MFAPVFALTSDIAKALMAIEAARAVILDSPMDVAMLAGLRQTAQLLATHYSTQIEGNRLTQAQVQNVLAGGRFPGRERDETEVRNYYRALEEIERLAAAPGPVLEADLQRIHGLVLDGRTAATPYRDGQNVIRDAHSGAMIYLPPEAKDVGPMMADLFDWINARISENDLPPPIIAALAHYQYATIHPYCDGNGRTARLLTNLILHKTGYGLGGIYSLEEYYAQKLGDYYAALTVGASHNYYFGRAEADVSAFIRYFCQGMADAFAAVRQQAQQAKVRGGADLSPVLRRIDARQRRGLELFHRQGVATAAEIAAHLGLSPRTVVDLCRGWLASGFLELHDPSRKQRAYRLAPAFEAAVTSGPKQ